MILILNEKYSSYNDCYRFTIRQVDPDDVLLLLLLLLSNYENYFLNFQFVVVMGLGASWYMETY